MRLLKMIFPLRMVLVRLLCLLSAICYSRHYARNFIVDALRGGIQTYRCRVLSASITRAILPTAAYF